MIRQYSRIKNQYPDSILFFRLGDFYEMFFDDAKTASKILGITLTSRNKNEKNPVPLCGVPYHSAEPYVSKLLKSGYKVAICEQTEDPKNAKGVVERKVVKVLTPGAITDTEKLDSKTNNFLASVYTDGTGYSLSYADISTGEFRAAMLNDLEELKSELSRIEAREILIQQSVSDNNPDFIQGIRNSWNPLVSCEDLSLWDLESAKDLLLEHYGINTLIPFGLEGRDSCIISSAVLLDYIKTTQMDYMPLLGEPQYYSKADYLLIDESTKNNLELLKTIRGEKDGPTLLWVLDMTRTAMGGRLLKNWINYPLVDIGAINVRLGAVSQLVEKQTLRNELRKELGNINDIERLIGRISTPGAKPRDLSGLRDSSLSISVLKDLLRDVTADELITVRNDLDDLSDIREYLSVALVDEPPATPKDGGLIRKGFSTELDELRELQTSGRKWISDLELNERKRTGISSLKTGYNKVFGYYIEVTKTNLDLVPESYIRKQTLANAERYITPELKEYEEKIATAEERIIEIEKTLFDQLRTYVSGHSKRVRTTSSMIARLDVFCSLSEAACEYDYTMPVVEESCILELTDSRHPVVERIEPGGGFVPNDISIDTDDNQFLLITGPNMAGKSTLIRQSALIVLMAQLGSFVPATSARIGVADRIFTRVGAADNLAGGLSTFMLEMVETSYILRNATPRSLVILDEIGRGTSTFDGMSIAWAVAEFLHDLGARTLFATHYHELANLPVRNERIKNYNVAVRRSGEKIVFIRKLVPGATSHSYGIEVARLAGVPDRVIKSARIILRSLEKMKTTLSESITGEQITLFEAEDTADSVTVAPHQAVIERLESLDPERMTPIEAITALAELRNILGKDKGG